MDLPVPHSLYHGPQWPGDAKSQSISSYDIDLIFFSIFYFQDQGPDSM